MKWWNEKSPSQAGTGCVGLWRALGIPARLGDAPALLIPVAASLGAQAPGEVKVLGLRCWFRGQGPYGSRCLLMVRKVMPRFVVVLLEKPASRWSAWLQLLRVGDGLGGEVGFSDAGCGASEKCIGVSA